MVHTTMNNMTKALNSRKVIRKLKKTKKSGSSGDVQKDGTALRAFANSVGDFIRYWGFRRIHGQIWAVVFLSKEPLSGVQLIKILGVSKALVSPALAELLLHKLILMAGGDLKTKYYKANPDVVGVIADVLSSRETALLKDAQNKFNLLKDSSSSQLSNMDSSRLNEVETMISVARVGLDLILQNIKQGDLRLLNSLVSADNANAH